MEKKKILIIVFSVLAAVVFAILATLIGLNYKKIEAWFNGSQLYTYDELQEATQESYNKGVKDKESLLERNEKLKIDVRNLSEKVATLTADNNAKMEELIDLKSQISFLKKLINNEDTSSIELTDELSELEQKLNELLQEKYNQGYNAGYAEGLANGSVNLPEGSFALILVPNIPSNCTSNITGKMTSSVNSCSAALVLPNCEYSLKGYTFHGWNTKSDGTGTTYLNGATVLANSVESGAALTLYAQWQAITYKVVFDRNLPPAERAGNSSSIYIFNPIATGTDLTELNCVYDVSYSINSDWGYYSSDVLGVSAPCTLIGFALSPNGEVVVTNSSDFKNLTFENNGVVTLYAVYSELYYPDN